MLCSEFDRTSGNSFVSLPAENRIFALANIYMSGCPRTRESEFCKFTNETRNGSKTRAHIRLKFLAASMERRRSGYELRCL